MPGAHIHRNLAGRERPSSSEVSIEPPKVDHVLEEHMMVMKSLWKSKEGFDFTLCCSATEFQVHSFLLKPRSTFFAAACEGNFLEATTKRIELPDDDTGSVDRMIDYCYTMDYSDEKAEKLSKSGESIEPSYISRAHTNIQVYILADKYDIPGLKVLARMKFVAAAAIEFNCWGSQNSPPNMAHLMAIIALIHNSTPETDLCLQFHTLIATNPELIINAVNGHFSHGIP